MEDESLHCFLAPGVRQLCPDDNPKLHELSKHIDENPGLAAMHKVASGEITWAEYCNGKDRVGRAALGVFCRATFVVRRHVLHDTCYDCSPAFLEVEGVYGP